jgi:hypothetical protein
VILWPPWLRFVFAGALTRIGGAGFLAVLGLLGKSDPRDFPAVFRGRLTKEQTLNYVLSLFMEDTMFRAVVEEAAALTSIALFVGMIAVWAQVFAVM